jgi:hypothetical protein
VAPFSPPSPFPLARPRMTGAARLAALNLPYATMCIYPHPSVACKGPRRRRSGGGAASFRFCANFNLNPPTPSLPSRLPAGPRSPSKGAETPAWLATRHGSVNDLTGGFYYDGRLIAW